MKRTLSNQSKNYNNKIFAIVKILMVIYLKQKRQKEKKYETMNKRRVRNLYKIVEKKEIIGGRGHDIT